VANDAWLLQIVAEDQVAKLFSLHAAILKWEQIAKEDLASDLLEDEKYRKDGQEWVWDLFNDRAFMLLETKRVMCANLAVSVSATVETFLGTICRLKTIPLLDNNGYASAKPDWGVKRRAVELFLKIRFFALTDFTLCNRARLLGNCFKHNEAKTSQEYVDAFAGPVNQTIEYEEVDWPQIIHGTGTFLMTLAKKL
jgi:hypothetical protein